MSTLPKSIRLKKPLAALFLICLMLAFGALMLLASFVDSSLGIWGKPVGFLVSLFIGFLFPVWIGREYRIVRRYVQKGIPPKRWVTRIDADGNILEDPMFSFWRVD